MSRPFRHAGQRGWLRRHAVALVTLVLLVPGVLTGWYFTEWKEYANWEPRSPVEAQVGEPAHLAGHEYEVTSWDVLKDPPDSAGLPAGTGVVAVTVAVRPPGPDAEGSCELQLAIDRARWHPAENTFQTSEGMAETCFWSPGDRDEFSSVEVASDGTRSVQVGFVVPVDALDTTGGPVLEILMPMELPRYVRVPLT